MGCAHRRNLSQSLEKNYFFEFEVSLGLSLHTSMYLDRTFYRFSENGFLSRSQFNSCCAYLSIDRYTHQIFFENFIINCKYSAKLLSCLGILLGSGKSSEKILILFQNYDNDCSNTLDSNEIIHMINDIATVACVFIPNYVCKMNVSNDFLERYFKKLCLCSKGFASKAAELILDDLDQITFQWFKERFRVIQGLKSLLSSKKLRKLVSLEYKKLFKPFMYADYFLENKDLDGFWDKKIKGRERSMSY